MNYHIATHSPTNLQLKENAALITVAFILAFLLALWIIILYDSLRNIYQDRAKKSNKKKNLKKVLGKLKRVGNVHEQSF